MGKKHFCFFQTTETGNRTRNSGVKGSGANHYPRAPARILEGQHGAPEASEGQHGAPEWQHGAHEGQHGAHKRQHGAAPC